MVGNGSFAFGKVVFTLWFADGVSVLPRARRRERDADGVPPLRVYRRLWYHCGCWLLTDLCCWAPDFRKAVFDGDAFG